MRRSGRFDSLLALAERSIVVADLLGDRQLYFIDPDQPARLAGAELRQQSFDIAPLREEPINRYIVADETRDDPGAASDAAHPIGVELVVSSALPLADAVSALGHQPFVFVLDGNHVAGLLTRADLQLTPVSLVAFGFVLAIEAALDVLIDLHVGDNWTEKLSPDRRNNVKKIFEDRRHRNTDISERQCLNLDDRVTIAEKTETIWRALGFSSRNLFASRAKEIKHLRNELAHGGNLLDAKPDPAEAAGLFADIRAIAANAWQAVDTYDGPITDE